MCRHWPGNRSQAISFPWTLECRWMDVVEIWAHAPLCRAASTWDPLPGCHCKWTWKRKFCSHTGTSVTNHRTVAMPFTMFWWGQVGCHIGATWLYSIATWWGGAPQRQTWAWGSGGKVVEGDASASAIVATATVAADHNTFLFRSSYLWKRTSNLVHIDRWNYIITECQLLLFNK